MNPISLQSVAEYVPSGIDIPIGVAAYQLVRALLGPLVTSLPTVEQLESELAHGGLRPPGGAMNQFSPKSPFTGSGPLPSIRPSTHQEIWTWTNTIATKTK